MRRFLLVAALMALMVGCNGAPAAVRPTLAGIIALGYRCGEGMKDNVPSGLFQWQCHGAVDGTASSVLVDGNEEGVATITQFINESNDPEIVRVGFSRLVTGVPPLKAAPALVDALRGWPGEQKSTVVGQVRIFAECEATHCIVSVMPYGDALHPMELP
jgi:hypothetical protein